MALTAAQAGSPVPSSREALPLFVLSVVAALLAGGWYLGRENTVRRRLIDDLAAANAGLRAASAANSRLHEQLIEQARQAGVQDERHRMAREIHDTLARDLSAVVAQLEVALTSAEYGDQWRRPVARARAVARDGLSEARHSVRALASPLLDNAALPEALEHAQPLATLPPGFPAGASHGSELMDLFDVAGRQPITSGYYTPAQRRLARDLITCWTAFARAGHPSGAGLPAWPVTRPGHAERPALRLAPGPGGIRPADAAAEHQCAFWLR